MRLSGARQKIQLFERGHRQLPGTAATNPAPRRLGKLLRDARDARATSAFTPIASKHWQRKVQQKPRREAGAALIVAQEQGAKGDGVLKDYVLALFALPAAGLLVYVLNAAR